MIFYDSDREFEFSILPQGDDKQMYMFAKNAGQFFYAQKISKDVIGGALIGKGNFRRFDDYDLKISNISKLYVNRGPGSFAGIRNSLAVVKAIYVARKIDYYCFSFSDFDKLDANKYENIPNLCDKLRIKKNLIKPIYIS